MDLSDAREIKLSAMERLARRPTVRAQAAELVGQAVAAVLAGDRDARSVTTVLPAVSGTRESRIGLGISLAEVDQAKLAVRYPWLDRLHAPLLDELTELAKGEIDALWTGPVLAHTDGTGRYRRACRPIVIGSSVAHPQVTAGTVGGFVSRGREAELLSCNHVLADCNRAAVGDPILQPGPIDGGSLRDSVVGRLTMAIPLDHAGTNTVDCAVAEVQGGIATDPARLEGYGQLAGIVSPDWYEGAAVGQAVAKIGRTSEATEGTVSAIEMSWVIPYQSAGAYEFDDLIEIRGTRTAFSQGGDSGALVFRPSDCRGCGMVVAGSDVVTYIARLDRVLSRLGAELVV